MNRSLRATLLALGVLALLTSSCNVERLIEEAMEKKRAEVEQAAREEMKEEFNRQSQRLIGLLVRYSNATHRLVLSITQGIGKNIYIRFDPETKEVVFDEAGLRADFGLDIKDKIVARLNALARLGETIYAKGREDLTEMAQCSELPREGCEITPDRLIEGLLEIEPGDQGLLEVQEEFRKIQAEVKAMLQEKYWLEIADERTRNILRRVFGL